MAGNEGSNTTGNAAFAYPSFRFYMGARALVTAASEMQAVAVGWQVYSITGKALDLGLVGLAQFLPGILLFLVAGHTADRFPRRHILRCCYVAFAAISATLFALTLHGLHSVMPVYGVLLLNGVVRAFNTPASQAFLPLVVPEDVFPNAVAWGMSVFQGAQILGPVIGGAVYGIAGNAAPVYAGSVLCSAGAFVFMSLLRTGTRARRPAPSGVIEGLRYLWRTKMVLGAISLDMFAVLLGGAVALLPVFAKDVLHVGAGGLGVLRGAPGIGAVLMALLLAHRPLARRPGAVMLWCVAGFGLFTIVFGLSRNMALSLLALVLVGICDMVSVVVRHTLVQVATPDEMRGRVSAVNSVFIGASNEVGQFESGLTAAWFGAVPAVILGGIGTLVVVAVWATLFPDLRRAEHLQPNSPE
ncbi:MAG: MFS transporter [Acidobacteria bacterium]|nr:MFS transporter [Acidobacteriota bacterium]